MFSSILSQGSCGQKLRSIQPDLESEKMVSISSWTMISSDYSFVLFCFLIFLFLTWMCICAWVLRFSVVVINTLTKNNLAHTSGNSSSPREARAGSQAETTEAHCWLPCFLLLVLSLLSHTSQGHLLRVGMAHSGLWSPTSTSNEEKFPQTSAPGNDQGHPSAEVPSQLLVVVNLTTIRGHWYWASDSTIYTFLFRTKTSWMWVC